MLDRSATKHKTFCMAKMQLKSPSCVTAHRTTSIFGFFDSTIFAIICSLKS